MTEEQRIELLAAWNAFVEKGKMIVPSTYDLPKEMLEGLVAVNRCLDPEAFFDDDIINIDEWIEAGEWANADGR